MCFLKVTVLQIERSSAKAENFSFVLDPTLSNATVYLTGDSLVFNLYSPTGTATHYEQNVLNESVFLCLTGHVTVNNR